MNSRRQLSVICCPSLRPELEQLAAGSGADITFQHLEMALHDRSAEALRQALQTAIDATTDCDAIAIGYGLCNRGIVGVRARKIPLVIPRAHDCIALLLGSTRRYLGEMDREPGTFFQSAGWLEAARDVEQRQDGFTFGPNSNVTFERLAARFGEEAAHYLVEQLEGFTSHYKRLAYIATPVTERTALEAEARRIAETKGLEYQCLAGDTAWLCRLLEGDWRSEEFLVVQPGQSVVFAGGDGLIEAE